MSSALNPDEFRKLVSDCNRILKIYGKNTYRLSKSEIKYRNLIRRVFVAKTDIKKRNLTTKNLAAKRSSKTNGYYDINKLLEKTKSEIKKDTVITANNLK